MWEYKTMTALTIQKIKRWWKELFFKPWVELTYDVSNGEYAIRQRYRSTYVTDKFNWREYNRVLPTKRMFIKHEDMQRLMKSAEHFLDTHKKYGKVK